MNTLHDHKLLIDSECPLCRGYSSAFVKWGLLAPSSVLPFEEGEAFESLDTQRGKDEIALVNTKDGSVLYGVDSLVKVLGNSFGLLRYLASVFWIKALLNPAYRFVSFNRKVIVPTHNGSCYPSYSLKHRVLFILVVSLFSSYILYSYSLKLHGWVSVQGYRRELLLSFGQLFFQSLFLIRLPFSKLIDYLGNLTVVSLMGSLVLLVVLAFGYLVPMTGLYYMLCFGAVVGLIFLEHWRRVKVLSLPQWLCLTWVVYRMLLLILLYI